MAASTAPGAFPRAFASDIGVVDLDPRSGSAEFVAAVTFDHRLRQLVLAPPRCVRRDTEPPTQFVEAGNQSWPTTYLIGKPSGTRVSEAERVLQLAIKRAAQHIGGDRGTTKLQQQTTVEIEPQSFTRRSAIAAPFGPR